MSQTETISLRQTAPSGLGELEVQNEESGSIGHEQADPRRNSPKTKKTCVLIGSGLIQLPIWGMRLQPLQTSFQRERHSHMMYTTQASQ